MRFIAGLGIGGVMPNVVALMTEYMPRKIRSTMVAVMFSGYSVGGMTSAFLGMYLMPSHGWQSVFFVAGIPLLLLPLIWIFLPEAVASCSRKVARKRPAACSPASSCLTRPQPATTSTATGQGRSVALVALFQNGRLVSTLMFWVASSAAC